MRKHLFSALCILMVLSSLAGCKQINDEKIPVESTPVKNEMSDTVGEKTDDYSLALREIGEKKELIVFNADEKKQLMSIDISWDEHFGDKFAYTADVNFDGKKDILIPYLNPASAVYFKAYIYLPEEKSFAYAPTFETIPNFSLDNETRTVLGSRTASRITTYSMSKYSSEKKDFVITNSIYYEPTEDEENYEFVETEFDKNGKAKFEKKYIVPIEKVTFNMDRSFEKLKPYYEKGSFWDLKSEKWNFEYLDLIK
ncbi:MAG: hypothetical protein KBS52_02350 [Clostridiales bacterium]|nr:hypothetical protein [Candidatus Equinaster intestinalis]